MKSVATMVSRYLCLSGKVPLRTTVRSLTERWRIMLTTPDRYASEAALAKHEGSENYKDFFKKVMEEELLAGPPLITRTKRSEGFKR